jgi:hypothetical protein
VRALAWWHAIPQPPPSNLKGAPRQLPETRSRIKRLKDGVTPDLPDIPAEYSFLISYLFDAGPISHAAQRGVPLTWADLEAWQRGAGVSLPPWQLRLIRHLSSEYLSESMIADAHDAPPPWDREPDRDKIEKHIKKLFRK